MNKKNLSIFRDSWMTFAILILGYSIISTLLTYSTSVLLERLIDESNIYGIKGAISRNIEWLVLFAFLAIGFYIIHYLKSVFYARNHFDTTIKVFRKIINIPVDMSCKESSGELYSLINSDLPLALSIYAKIERVLNKISLSVGSALYIFSVDYRMGCVISCFGIIIIILIRIIFCFLSCLFFFQFHCSIIGT